MKEGMGPGGGGGGGPADIFDLFGMGGGGGRRGAPRERRSEDVVHKWVLAYLHAKWTTSGCWHSRWAWQLVVLLCLSGGKW